MEEDIKILEEFIEHIKFVEERTLYELEAKERCKKRYKAIENLLKAYKQDEKMIDLMAEDMIMTRPMTTEEYRNSSHSEYSNGRIIMSNKEIKEYFRKKVETNE